MSIYTEIAKQFKTRDNPNIDEPVIGIVLSVNPLSVSLFNGAIVLNSNLIYVCQSLITIEGTIAIDPFSDTGGHTHNVNHKFKITRDLKKGDKVMCVPTDGGQRYFIVDKVV